MVTDRVRDHRHCLLVLSQPGCGYLELYQRVCCQRPDDHRDARAAAKVAWSVPLWKFGGLIWVEPVPRTLCELGLNMRMTKLGRVAG